MPHLLQITIPASSTEKCRQDGRWETLQRNIPPKLHARTAAGPPLSLRPVASHPPTIDAKTPRLPVFGSKKWGLSASEPSIT